MPQREPSSIKNGYLFVYANIFHAILKMKNKV